ncbi:MAG: hypothetical protein PVF83_03215 [Anaerolineales bacterium]
MRRDSHLTNGRPQGPPLRGCGWMRNFNNCLLGGRSMLRPYGWLE